MPKEDITGFPVNSVSLVIGYETKSGIEEVVHTVDGKKNDIVMVQHHFERKTRAVKDDRGEVIAYEPTGEEILTLKVKYIKGV